MGSIIRRFSLRLASIVLVGAALLVSLLPGRESPPPPDAPAPAASPGVPDPPKATSPPASTPGGAADASRASASRPTSPRPGRTLGVDAAIRELDLIRPSREKLAEDFTLNMSDGTRFRLRDHRGKVILVNFWATWCGPCREEMPAMERLYRRHKDDGLVVLAISVDTDPGLISPFVKEHRLTFPIGLDSEMKVANTYGIRALPASFLVDREGRLVALALGPRGWDNDAAHSLVEGIGR